MVNQLGTDVDHPALVVATVCPAVTVTFWYSFTVTSGSPDFAALIVPVTCAYQLPGCRFENCLPAPLSVPVGEPLPSRFNECMAADVAACDLLLVMGTSLLVYPVAALPSHAPPMTVRVLFNKEPSGCFQYVPPSALRATPSDGPDTTRGDSAFRDVFVPGECDAAADALVDALGWAAERARLLDEWAA